MKKKLTITILMFVVGIGLIILGFLSTKSYKNVNEPNQEVNKNKYLESEIIVFDFQENESMQDIKVSFSIYNNTDKTFENRSLFLDYYENNNKIYTAEFDVDGLKSGEELKITDKSLVFLYDKISNYKFRFGNEEVPITSKEEYLKEFKKLDANKIKIEEENVK